MKSHNEMYQSLLSRYNEYQEKKQKRIRTLRRIAPVLACFVIAAGLGLGYWYHLDKTPIIPSDSDIVEVTTEAVTSSVTENITTVTTVPITAKTSATQKTASVSATTSISTAYAVTEVYTQAVTSDAVRTMTTKVQLTSTAPQTVTTTSSVTYQPFNEGGNTGFEYTTTGDMAFVHTTTQTVTTVTDEERPVTAELVTTAPVTTTKADDAENYVSPQPINEKYGFGIIDGYDGWYINAFKISSDYVDEYIGVIVMRSASAHFLDAKAYKIKNIEDTVAIAVKFEEDEGYYLYRNNNTSIDTIKELISPEE